MTAETPQNPLPERVRSLSIGQMTFGSFMLVLAVIVVTGAASVIAIRHIDQTFAELRRLQAVGDLAEDIDPAVKELDEDLWRFTTDVLFGEIWSRPGLSLRERELVTLATLMAAKADGIALHMRHAHNLGISFDEMKEVILQATIYLGMPKALFAMRKLKAVMAEGEGGGSGAKT